MYQRKDRSFFDFTDEEKQEVVNKAADEANKAQQELVESVTQQDYLCHCHTGHTPACEKTQVCPFHCEHCTQQKDARADLIEQIRRRYDLAVADGVERPDLWFLGEMKDFASKVETQARQQALKDALEAAPTKHETVGTSEVYYNTAIDDFRANIEKLTK